MINIRIQNKVFCFRCLVVLLCSMVMLACEGEMKTLPDNNVYDIDGNKYPIVRIGSQCWMGQNLKTTRYADGTAIPRGHDSLNLYQNDSALYYFDYPDVSYFHPYHDDLKIYLDNTSKMYTWSAATKLESQGRLDELVQGICPDGWRLPNKEDWDELIEFVGDSVVGQQLKSTDPAHWLFESEYVLGTDIFGFNAVGSGGRDVGGAYYVFERTAYFWSASTMDEAWRVWTFPIVHWNNEVEWRGTSKSNAFCVRCLQNK